MEEDLKNEGYRLIYFATMIFVFCVIPTIYILSNTDLNRRERTVDCDKPIAVKEVISEGRPGDANQFKYKLDDDSEYTSSVKYQPGDQVCRI